MTTDSTETEEHQPTAGVKWIDTFDHATGEPLSSELYLTFRGETLLGMAFKALEMDTSAEAKMFVGVGKRKAREIIKTCLRLKKLPPGPPPRGLSLEEALEYYQQRKPRK